MNESLSETTSILTSGRLKLLSVMACFSLSSTLKTPSIFWPFEFFSIFIIIGLVSRDSNRNKLIESSTSSRFMNSQFQIYCLKELKTQQNIFLSVLLPYFLFDWGLFRNCLLLLIDWIRRLPLRLQIMMLN